MAERGGRNLYSYVLNTPLNYFDLLGLCGCEGGAQNVQDSTGASCCPEKLQHIDLQTDWGLIGHTWISIGGNQYGHFPVGGLRNIILGGDGSGTTDTEPRHIPSGALTQHFTACPATVKNLQLLILQHWNDPWEIINIGGKNCASWACSVLGAAGFQPVVPPLLPTAPITMPYPNPGPILGGHTGGMGIP